MKFTTLNNGLKMPMEGFGVYQVTNQSECEASVYDAILAGCRLTMTHSIGNRPPLQNTVRNG